MNQWVSSPVVPNKDRFFRLFLLAVVIMSPPQSTLAQASPVALAYPVENITIDGDLSDWPDGLASYPVTRRGFGVMNEGPNDFEGWFRLGYNLDDQDFYVGVEMVDDFYLEGRRGDYLENDGCFVVVHGISTSTIPLPIAWLRSGSYNKTVASFWTPVELRYGQIQMKRNGSRTTFEFQIDFAAFSVAEFSLAPGTVFRMNVVLCDADPASAATPAATAERRRSYFAWQDGNLMASRDFGGDVVLMAKDAATGVLAGNVSLAGGHQPKGYKPIRVQA
jgi:hypothetical protein